MQTLSLKLKECAKPQDLPFLNFSKPCGEIILGSHPRFCLYAIVSRFSENSNYKIVTISNFFEKFSVFGAFKTVFEEYMFDSCGLCSLTAVCERLYNLRCGKQNCNYSSRGGHIDAAAGQAREQRKDRSDYPDNESKAAKLF